MRKTRLTISVTVLLLVTASVVFGDLTNGLVAYYPFNGNANDASGTGNNGSLVGGATWTTGVFGGAIHLDGTGYVSVPDSPSLDLPGAKGTISAFIKVDPSSNEFGIVSKESSSSFPSTIAYEFDLVGSGVLDRLVLGLSDGTGTDSVPYYGASLKDSLWHHIAATWSGPGGQVLLYLNGVQVAQGNQTISMINNISEPVYIGAYRWHVDGEYRCMTGDMDEVRIYDRALSADEIGHLSVVPVPGAVVLVWIGLVSAVGCLRRQRTA